MNIEKLIDLENVSIDTEASCPVTGEKVKETFCDHWKQSKKGLELLSLAIKNPVVKIFITLIIAVGDGAEKKFCG